MVVGSRMRSLIFHHFFVDQIFPLVDSVLSLIDRVIVGPRSRLQNWEGGRAQFNYQFP